VFGPPVNACGISDLSSQKESSHTLMTSQIDEDYIRVLSHPVEQNLPAVRGHIKATDGIARFQVGKLAALPGLEIDRPEVLIRISTKQGDHLFAVWQKPETISSR
jgi:hypothetical protein